MQARSKCTNNLLYTYADYIFILYSALKQYVLTGSWRNGRFLHEPGYVSLQSTAKKKSDGDPVWAQKVHGLRSMQMPVRLWRKYFLCMSHRESMLTWNSASDCAFADRWGVRFHRDQGITTFGSKRKQGPPPPESSDEGRSASPKPALRASKRRRSGKPESSMY